MALHRLVVLTLHLHQEGREDQAGLDRQTCVVGSIGAFFAGKLQLFQVLYARTGSKTVPWTRAHVYADRS